MIKIETLKIYLQKRINGLHISPHFSIANEYVKGYKQSLTDILNDLNNNKKDII